VSHDPLVKPVDILIYYY